MELKNDVLMLLLLTLEKYLFCSETFMFGDHKIAIPNIMQAKWQNIGKENAGQMLYLDYIILSWTHKF